MRSLICALLCLLTGTGLLAQAEGFYIHWGRWNPDVDGDTATNVNDVIDVASDLALDDDAPDMLSFKMIGRKHVLAYSTWDLGLSETSTLDHTIGFGGVVFDPGEEIDASLDTKYQEIQYRYLLLTNNMFRVGGVLAYQKIDTSMKINDILVGDDSGNPAFGVSLTAASPRGHMYGDVLFLYGRGSDFDGYMMRAEAGIDLLKGVGVNVGVQAYDLNYDFDDNAFDWTFSGVFAGIYLHI